MKYENNKDRGRAGLSLAIAYFGANGYTVSVPLNDTQWYDLIIEKDGIFNTVQCKFTSSIDNRVNLRSCGGTKGTVYDNLLNHPVDILFCADKDFYMYSIPVKDIIEAGNANSILLRNTPNPHSCGFNTSKY